MMEEWHYHLSEAERAVRVLRFIEDNCDEGDDVYQVFTVQRVANAISETRQSLDFSNRTIEEAGFLDAFESHTDEILAGLRPEHLPVADKQVLKDMGSPDVDAELAELVFRARGYREKARQLSREVSTREQLRQVAEQIGRVEKEFENFRSFTADRPASEAPKKSRRWFKGLGQIGQGAALSIANVALAVGVIQFPVSAETQTWGALASVATGIGTVLNGVGDLRDE